MNLQQVKHELVLRDEENRLLRAAVTHLEITLAQRERELRDTVRRDAVTSTHYNILDDRKRAVKYAAGQPTLVFAVKACWLVGLAVQSRANSGAGLNTSMNHITAVLCFDRRFLIPRVDRTALVIVLVIQERDRK